MRENQLSAVERLFGTAYVGGDLVCEVPLSDVVRRSHRLKTR